MRFILEADALQSVRSEIPAERWPCFALNRVSVLSQSTKEPVSMFSGHKNNAILVVGYLQEISEAHAHLVLDSSCILISSRLIVKNVTSWTCARSSSNGSVEFYAIGKAGKYLIRNPERLYENFFAQMTETASMFYFVEAKFRKMRKNVSELSESYANNYSRLNFNEYLNSASNSLKRESIDDVRAGFHEHAEYIITMMLAGAGGSERLDWEASPMMRYFKQMCPEQNAKARSLMNPNDLAKLSFRPNFRRQEPTTAPKRAKRLVLEDNDFDTADLAFSPRGPHTEGPGTVRRSTRRAALRTRTSLVPMHGLSPSPEPLDDTVEFNDSSLPSEPPTSIWDEIRQRKLEADPEPYTYGPSKYVERTLVRFEFPAEEPQGPGGLWACEFKGCGFREHEADTAEGLERLRQHLHAVHEGFEEIFRNPRDSQQASAFKNHTRRLGPELLEAMDEGSYQLSLRTNNAPTNHFSSLSSAGNSARSSGLLLNADYNTTSSITNVSSVQSRPATESLTVAGASSPHQSIENNIATSPAYYRSSARNLPTISPVPRDEGSSSRQTTRVLGNTAQSSYPSLSSNARNFATSEALLGDDGNISSAVLAPTRPRRRGVMRRY